LTVAAQVRNGQINALDVPPVGIASLSARLNCEWGDHLQEAASAALATGKAHLAARLETEIQVQLRMINEQRRRCAKVVGDGDSEVDRLDALAASITQWSVCIDTVGLLVLS